MSEYSNLFHSPYKPRDFAIAWITLCPCVQDHSAWHFGDNNILGLLLFPFFFLSTIFFWAIYFLPWFLVISSKKKIPTFNLKQRLLWSFTPNTWFPISPRMSQASPTQFDHIWVCCYTYMFVRMTFAFQNETYGCDGEDRLAARWQTPGGKMHLSPL